MPPRDDTRVRHALDAARKALYHAYGATREALDEDERLAFTLVHLLEIVGEACNQVSPGYQAAHPEVPWSKAIALRHRLTHGYFDVDLDIVWDTVTTKLPDFVARLEEILEQPPTD